MRGHSGETFHSRAGPRAGTRPERGQGCYPGQSRLHPRSFPAPGLRRLRARPHGAAVAVGAGGSVGRVLRGSRPCSTRGDGPGRGSPRPAERAGAQPSPREEAEQVPVPGGPRGSAGTAAARDPAGGRGAERPRGWRGRPSQPPGPPGSICRGREHLPRGAPLLLPCHRWQRRLPACPRLRAAGTRSRRVFLSIASALLAWRQQLPFFTFSTPLADLPHLLNAMAVCFPCLHSSAKALPSSLS